MELTIQILFKIYLLIAVCFFFFTYRQRYKKMETITLVSFLTGAFFLLSYKSEIVTFSANILMLVSLFGFSLTRLRPNKHTLAAIAISAFLILIYRTSPNIVAIMFLLICVFFCISANERSIEAFIITLVIPIIAYMCINYSLYNNSNLLFPKLNRLCGLTIIIISSLFVLFDKAKEKRMIFYALFYIGNFVFALGLQTQEAITLAVMMLFLMPLIYSPKLNFNSIFNLVMLPASPAFIIKLILITMILKADMKIEAGIIIIGSLIIMIFSISDLYNSIKIKTKEKIHVPILLQTLSITLLILSVIYLDTFRNIVKITIKAVNG